MCSSDLTFRGQYHQRRSRLTMRPGSLTKVRAPEGSTSQCQPDECQSRTSPSGLIKRGIGKAGAEEKQRVEERRRRVEEGDGLARTGDEVVGIYAQLGTSTRIVCFLRAFVSRWISGVFLSGACEPIDQRAWSMSNQHQAHGSCVSFERL